MKLLLVYKQEAAVLIFANIIVIFKYVFFREK